MKPIASLILALALFFPPSLRAQDTGHDPIADFPKRVHRITLDNGMRALVVERPESPTVSFVMYIRTGGIDDDMGQSGLAHMFEHMLFKGTRTIGTKDYA